jgi:dihydroorotase
MSTEAARIFNIPGGTLRPGHPADVVVLDPNRAWVVDPAKSFSKSRNTPFGGTKLKGSVEMTIVRGSIVFRIEN